MKKGQATSRSLPPFSASGFPQILLLPLANLLRRQIFLAGGDRPEMSEGINDSAVSVRPERIFQQHLHLRAGGPRTLIKNSSEQDLD
jgi:hypothetical protein